MTEYDFSPEAYEKYMATQTRVSNWVSDQVSRMPEYAHPDALPSKAPSWSGSVQSGVSRSRSIRVAPPLQPIRIPKSRSPPRTSPVKTSSRHRREVSPPPMYPPPPMPISIPPPVDFRQYSRYSQERPPAQHVRSHTLPMHPGPPPLSPPPGGSYHSSRRYVPAQVSVYPAGAPHGAHSTYHYDPAKREIVLPPGHYVLMPPQRGRYEVVHGPEYHTDRSSSRSSSARTPAKGPALFKRILGSISPTGRSRGGMNQGEPPRRLRRHSTSQY